MDTKEMLQVCHRHILPANIEAVFPEPYIPFFPEGWKNGVLVIAEAQHLGEKNNSYRLRLRKKSPEGRMTRLGAGEYTGGVAPWTDNTLMFAVEAALGVKAGICAVSNAVPWSQVDAADNNVRPSKELVRRAKAFWEDTLPLLEPKVILACGEKAHEVFSDIESRSNVIWNIYKPRHPSTLATASLIPRFPREEAELELQFPEVADIARRHADWLEKNRAHKIAYACHVVKVVRAQDKR